MENPSNDKWTSDQRSLLVAAYEITFAEEGRPNWNLLAKRYQKAASELDLPFRSTMALRKQWSRTDETHHDPDSVANFSALIRQHDNAKTPLLSSTDLSGDANSPWNFETGIQVSPFSDAVWPGAQNARGNESQDYDISYGVSWSHPEFSDCDTKSAQAVLRLFGWHRAKLHAARAPPGSGRAA